MEVSPVMAIIYKSLKGPLNRQIAMANGPWWFTYLYIYLWKMVIFQFAMLNNQWHGSLGNSHCWGDAVPSSLKDLGNHKNIQYRVGPTMKNPFVLVVFPTPPPNRTEQIGSAGPPHLHLDPVPKIFTLSSLSSFPRKGILEWSWSWTLGCDLINPTFAITFSNLAIFYHHRENTIVVFTSYSSSINVTSKNKTFDVSWILNYPMVFWWLVESSSHRVMPFSLASFLLVTSSLRFQGLNLWPSSSGGFLKWGYPKKDGLYGWINPYQSLVISMNPYIILTNMW